MISWIPLWDQNVGVADMIVHNPPPGLFDRLLVPLGWGAFVFLTLWGLSKVIRAVKDWTTWEK